MSICFSEEKIKKKMVELDNWQLIKEDVMKLEKSFSFSSFQQGLDFVTKVGAVAELQNHHPKIILEYAKVLVEIYTHSQKGLTEKDFAFAQAVDQIA